jgi:chaperonin GroES
MTKLKPLGERLIVEPIEQEDTTSGGILIPETAKEKPQEGKVLAAGPGKLDDSGKRVKMEVKVGDRVLYARYAGTEIKIEENKKGTHPKRERRLGLGRGLVSLDGTYCNGG